SQTSVSELVAYVVPEGTLSVEPFIARLQMHLPRALVPRTVVPIARVPRSQSGDVDERALAEIEVIDADVVQKWEEQIASMPDVERVVVVPGRDNPTPPPFHVYDLLGAFERPTNNAVHAAPARAETGTADVLEVSPAI